MPRVFAGHVRLLRRVRDGASDGIRRRWWWTEGCTDQSVRREYGGWVVVVGCDVVITSFGFVRFVTTDLFLSSYLLFG